MRRLPMLFGRAGGGGLLAGALVTAAALVAVGGAVEGPARILRAARLVDAAPERGLVRAGPGEGTALLDAAAMAPGDVVRGELEVANREPRATALTLTAAMLEDRPGPNGGAVSSRLLLRVDEDPGGQLIYDGPITGLALRALGTFPPGASRRYRVTVAFPDGGTPPSPTTGDNAYQGSSLTMALRWAPDVAVSASSVTMLGRSRRRLATVLARGVRVRVLCPRGCTAAVTLTIDAKTARRLGLAKAGRRGPVVVGTATASAPAAQAAFVHARPSSRARRRLAGARRVALMVTASLTGPDGPEPAARRHIVLVGPAAPAQRRSSAASSGR